MSIDGGSATLDDAESIDDDDELYDDEVYEQYNQLLVRARTLKDTLQAHRNQAAYVIQSRSTEALIEHRTTGDALAQSLQDVHRELTIVDRIIALGFQRARAKL